MKNNLIIKRSSPWKLSLFGSLALCFSASAADVYVSSRGSDSNTGASPQSPLGSLSAARDLVRRVAGKQAVTVHVADGVYYLPETLVFTPADSGSEKYPIVYRAVNEGKAVLSGGSKLDLNWKPYRDGIFQCTTPAGLEIDQLFINGKNQRMARYPNYDANQPTAAYQGFAADAFSKERAAGWDDPTGGYIHAMHRSRWGGYHYIITGKGSDGNVTYEGGWQNNRKMGMHKEYRMVENIFEELDAPGEWYHNAKTSTLYYMPAAGTDLNSAVVEVVRLRHLVEFQGDVEKPVEHITLQGFTVRHAARTFMETDEQMVRSDWAIYRGGAFLLTGTEDVSILDCEFDQVGGNAVFVNNYNRRTLIKGCHIHDTGASGVCFIGDPNAARDPLFEYNEKNDLDKIDRTVGPKTENYPAFGVVEDCLIHGIGRVERQPAGVTMDLAMKITVRDTSVYDCARSGINIGDGCWGGHLIERCDVFDTVLETHDHGSFNSWGRDRFWHADRLESQRVIDKEPNLPFLDAMYTTTIRDSRWRCDHGWDIDLDDGSSNYDIYNNLMLARGLKLREGFRRRVWNNITVNNGLHPHVWYNNSEDEVFSNIFMAPAKGARMPKDTAKGKRVDENLYFNVSEKNMKKYSKYGWEVNSIVGDPLFVDPANGDFRVKEGSPAFKIGFKNFPMDQFGVKKPSLKAIAKTPVIPVLNGSGGGQASAAAKPMVSVWLGASLHSLEGEEFSAFGTQQEDGGVALTSVPAGSPAAKAGLKEGDLIQGVNGIKVSDIDQLFKALSSSRSATLTLKVVRNQQTAELPVKRVSFVEIEKANDAGGFEKLRLPTKPSGMMSSNQKTGNEPLSSLVDGQLKAGYGPVFSNGVNNGAYKMDLGRVQSVEAITSWSYLRGKTRGAQKLTLYGSAAATNPGWDLDRYTPIGTIDTFGESGPVFTAASLRAVKGETLGDYRWIIWSVSPVDGDENTAFQELAVELLDE
ncbi:PDZ domain-containing protein [Pontiellaceae bacterium B12219]|nr:PDZ domain-containing protein [Pontiellaceae bacterium B12219]